MQKYGHVVCQNSKKIGVFLGSFVTGNKGKRKRKQAGFGPVGLVRLNSKTKEKK